MPVIPDVEAQELLNGLLMGKAFDDRIGSCAVIDIMNEFKDVELDYNLVGSISVQEEVGTRGIKIVANKEKPDLAIVFEGTPADDAFTNKDEAQGALGKGPQIRYRDNSMVAHEGFMRYVKNIAIANDIPLQEAVRTGGGTNAGVLHLSNEGIPTIVIGVPVRHAHTHYGIINLNDYENAVKLGIKLLKTFDEEIIRGI
jgi:putative aminopeptidase FrvX